MNVISRCSKIVKLTGILVCFLLFTRKGEAQTSPQFANGADIGWLSEMENNSMKFYSDAGVQENCRQILLDHCCNSIRLRVWVNPPTGCCSKDSVVAAAIKATTFGFRIMIDFHYSDTWADPGNQTKPAAWVNYTTVQLI